MNTIISIASRFCHGVRNLLLNIIMLFMGTKPEISINMQAKQDTWNDIYDSMVKLIGNNVVYINGSVKCYVREGKHAWQYMEVEKVRSIYVHIGSDAPKEEIWVTVSDGHVTTRTLSIPRNSNGQNTDIMAVGDVFSKIISLFKELPPQHETPAERLRLPVFSPSNTKTDEEFANEALE